MSILQERRNVLDLMSDELMVRETLEGEALERVFAGLRPEDPVPAPVAPPPPPAAPAERDKPMPAPRPRLAPGPSTP
jgi:hypothetical protein